jgi:glycosyltransferase involved in cell wall biosynthesis
MGQSQLLGGYSVGVGKPLGHRRSVGSAGQRLLQATRRRHGLETMKASETVVEVRVPTFNRPVLLRRALESLLAQAHSDWRAIVLDDGDVEPTRAVLDELRDSRFTHRPNERRLGAARNIGQGFSSTPYAGGAHFGVLEDDNFWHSTFLTRNLRIMADHDVSIVQSNQWIELPGLDEGPGEVLSATTLGECHAEGKWRPEQFKVPMLWRLPISNSGLFWRIDSRSDLRADDVPDALLQEWVRAFRIVDDVYFVRDPLGGWRANGPESQRSALGPKNGRWAGFLRREKAVQAMRREVYALIGRGNEFSEILSERFPAPLEIREEGVRRALLRWPASSRLPWARRVDLFAKASLLRLSV